LLLDEVCASFYFHLKSLKSSNQVARLIRLPQYKNMASIFLPRWSALHHLGNGSLSKLLKWFRNRGETDDEFPQLKRLYRQISLKDQAGAWGKRVPLDYSSDTLPSTDPILTISDHKVFKAAVSTRLGHPSWFRLRCPSVHRHNFSGSCTKNCLLPRDTIGSVSLLVSADNEADFLDGLNKSGSLPPMGQSAKFTPLDVLLYQKRFGEFYDLYCWICDLLQPPSQQPPPATTTTTTPIFTTAAYRQ
jgi:hypothetical protein